MKFKSTETCISRKLDSFSLQNMLCFDYFENFSSIHDVLIIIGNEIFNQIYTLKGTITGTTFKVQSNSLQSKFNLWFDYTTISRDLTFCVSFYSTHVLSVQPVIW